MTSSFRLMPRRALLSVTDKTGLADLARALARHGVALLSTGGSKAHLEAAGLGVEDVASLTQFPEIMDGRVKTLHPKVHGGLLAVRNKDEHAAAMRQHAILPIDLLAVNLYAFEEAHGRGLDHAAMIEAIDIGGPAMIRSAAKNHAHVAVLTDPADYDMILAELDAGGISLATRRHLAAKAFARTAAYDAAIAAWFREEEEEHPGGFVALGGRLIGTMRYGENPHQWAAFYKSGEKREGVASARQLQGKPLSYNNIGDADAAFELVAEFDPNAHAAAVLVKHANPCGAALGATLEEAFAKALAADPISAFGGIIALNRPLDVETARRILSLFVEVVIAPGIDEEAARLFAAKPNIRLLVTQGLPDPQAPGLTFKTVAGGFLVQERDAGRLAPQDLKVVTRRAPEPHELADLLFAMTIAKHMKSNAIAYAKNGQTLGLGAGQMSRVDAALLGARKAQEIARAAGMTSSPLHGCAVASDAFFPFADGLDAVIEAGARAVIQPGGSIRDAEVIARADAAGLAMVFTGMRHFRH